MFAAMNQIELFLIPLFIQAGLTFVLLFWLGPVRFEAVRRGEVKISDIALGQRVWPDRVTQISNAYANQFELPVLFYALALLAIVLRKVDLVLIAGAWIFALSRCVHAYVYTTSNHIPSRFRAFVVGAFVLAAMWMWLAVRIWLG